MKNIHLIRLVVLACSMIVAPAVAIASEADAQRLKSAELTPFGAERAGNKDGTIPEWNGGLTAVPAGYDVEGRRTDLFPQDKPMFSITALNVDQYADKLSPGQASLLKKFSEYRIDVYPTRRTAAAPQWVYDNTYQNAVRAEPVDGGLSLKNAFGGIPFPIPHSGMEAMWNHLLRWQGTAWEAQPEIYYVTGGQRILAASQDRWSQFPYYLMADKDNFNGKYSLYRVAADGPPIRAGEQILVIDPLDQVNIRTQAWIYVTGQRRVRKLAVAGYDTPTPNSAGLFNADEAAGFGGPMDRYEWKIAGKREMYVPYNSNKLLEPKNIEDVVLKTTLNPDYMRWELHRVWAIEANLKPGSRHTKPKRTFYLDEDTWAVVVADGWDSKGMLWTTEVNIPLVCPDLPGTFPLPFGIYDLINGQYIVAAMLNGSDKQILFTEARPDSFYTPAALAGEGLR